MNVFTATTSDLVAFYNANTPEKPVKKFATRAIAEARVSAILARLAAEANAPKRTRAEANAPKRTRAEGIAESWKRPEVAAARATRNSVTANGSGYTSVAAAFRALRLPMAKHIPFRMSLKAAGKAVFEHGSKSIRFALIEAE